MLAQYEFARDRDENLFYEIADGVCPVHFHKKIELMYVLTGTKKVYCGNKQFMLQPNQIFMVDSYTLHGYEESDGQQIVIVFPNVTLTTYYEFFGDKVLSKNILTDTAYCKKMLPMIKAVWEHKDDDNKMLYQANIDMLLSLLVEKLGVKEKSFHYSLSLVEEILNYINNNFTEDLSLDNLADHFGYSKYYFSRVFNSCLGTSITDYISIIRCSKVLALLKQDPDIDVSDAVFDCGFSSLQTFYRVLKKNYNYKNIKDLLI